MRSDQNSTQDASAAGFDGMPLREIYVYDEKTGERAPDVLASLAETPARHNLTPAKSNDSPEIQHPRAPRRVENEEKRFTFDGLTPASSLAIDSRDAEEDQTEMQSGEKKDSVRESVTKHGTKDVPPMENDVARTVPAPFDEEPGSNNDHLLSPAHRKEDASPARERKQAEELPYVPRAPRERQVPSVVPRTPRAPWSPRTTRSLNLKRDLREDTKACLIDEDDDIVDISPAPSDELLARNQEAAVNKTGFECDKMNMFCFS